MSSILIITLFFEVKKKNTSRNLTLITLRAQRVKIEFEPPITWFYFLGIIKLTIKLY